MSFWFAVVRFDQSEFRLACALGSSPDPPFYWASNRSEDDRFKGDRGSAEKLGRVLRRFSSNPEEKEILALVFVEIPTSSVVASALTNRSVRSRVVRLIGQNMSLRSTT